MTDIQTLTTVTAAEAALNGLAEGHDWVSVFWDKRDRRTPEISLMVDGDGQGPKAYLTKEVYAALVDQRIVGEDTYAGFHARRIHDFKTPPVPERTGPTANEVIEEVLRALLVGHQDLPLKTAFFRGINKGNVWNPINEEVFVTAAYGPGADYVNIAPNGGDAYVSAWTGGYWGDRVGDGVTVPCPRGADGERDVKAMLSPAFRADLLAAVQSQLALLDGEASR
jgi:hypothetical protein